MGTSCARLDAGGAQLTEATYRYSALGEYIPKAPTDEEAKRHNQSLPGMGGVFNTVNTSLYHYAGNSPVTYTDPDGREDFFSSLYGMPRQTFGSFGLNYILQNDSSIKLMCAADAASKGDACAQSQLKYAFHEASREMLSEISEKSGYASLAFLAAGCPEGASVFGGISMGADAILAIDDIIHGNVQEGATDLIIIGASFYAGQGTKKLVGKVAGISITVGKTGRYYEIGKRGAIKTESALRKIVAKNIASGYFGQEISPEIASQIVEKAAKGFKEILKNEE